MSHKNIKKFLSKKYIKQYFSQVKIYFTASALILFASMVLGYFFADSLTSVFQPVTAEMAKDVSENGLTFIGIFRNNLQANFIVMLFAPFLAIVSIFAIVFNGLLIGYVAGISNLILTVLILLPHGIFEIPAIILSLATAFMILHLVVKWIRGIFSRDLTFKEEWIKSIPLIKTIMVSAIVIFVLLVIAAYIEVYLTVDISIFIFKVLNSTLSSI